MTKGEKNEDISDINTMAEKNKDISVLRQCKDNKGGEFDIGGEI